MIFFPFIYIGRACVILIICAQQNDLAMVAKTSDSCRECFGQLRRLHKMRDRVDAASGYCTSNLEILASLCSITGNSEQQRSQTLSTAETALQGYVRSAKLLRDRIDNTVDLVSVFKSGRDPPIPPWW